jgi:hypothetical protein
LFVVVFASSFLHLAISFLCTRQIALFHYFLSSYFFILPFLGC